jgi:mono/diheme cytochrome c family protein
MKNNPLNDTSLRWLTLLVGLLLVIGLSACGVDLAGDITPPPGIQSTTASQPAPVTIAYPLVPPDPSQGQAIYAQNCAPCHGNTGQGDGPQAANLPNPVSAIGQLDIARASVPSNWFQIVTNGNINRYMPGFITGLDDRQRWDVLAYVYSLSMTPDILAQGQKVYAANCAGCHGATGKGDGPQSAGLSVQVPDFTAQDRLSQKSDNDLNNEIKQGISQGSSPAMPAFASQLSDADLWAVTSYVRALTFTNIPGVNLAVVNGNATPAASAAATSGTDASGTPQASTPTGQATPGGTDLTSQASSPSPTLETTLSVTTTPAIVNGTPVPVGSAHGKLILPADISSLPANLTVSLLGFDSNVTQVSSASASVLADGTFQFTNVPMPSGISFMTSVIFNKVTFNSSPSAGSAGANLDLPITIYDTSTDASGLTVDRLHVFFDFSTSNVLQVVELYIISNPTNKAIVAKDGQALVYFDLPKDATNLQFQDGVLGQRYIQTATGFGDTQAILPGSSQTQELFAFYIAYPGKADLSLPITMPVSAAVVMLPVGGVNLNSNQLVDSGQQSVQGQNFHIYTTSNIPAKTNLGMTIAGLPSAAATTTGTPSNSTSSILIGGGVFLIAVVAVGAFFYRSRRRRSSILAEYDEPETPEDDVDTLIDAIAALDDLHKAGNLPTPAYQQRRAEMKERLKKRMQETGTLPK